MTNPLYSALHGPTANNSQVFWFDILHRSSGEITRKYLQSSNPSIQPWHENAPLNLYNGKRFCVLKSEDDCEDGLFDRDNDASLGLYDHQKLNETFETVYGMKHLLRENMGTLGMMQYLVKRLNSKNGGFDFEPNCRK